jgi:hypothetical protein
VSVVTTMLLNYLGVWSWTTGLLWVIIFLAILTIIIHYINLGAVRESGRESIVMFLVSMVVKLILGGAFILYLIYLNPSETVSTVVAFFIFYVLFTTLEIHAIWQKLQQ